jgi:hypothetical protein
MPSPPTSKLQMIQQFGLEQSLSIGLDQQPPPPTQNGFLSANSSSPQPQFSASFGPGQIQFNNQQQHQNDQKKMGTTLARRWVAQILATFSFLYGIYI